MGILEDALVAVGTGVLDVVGSKQIEKDQPSISEVLTTGVIGTSNHLNHSIERLHWEVSLRLAIAVTGVVSGTELLPRIIIIGTKVGEVEERIVVR